MGKNKTLIVIAGPTAIGKTELGIKLALHFNTVVVSADSRQFYREMSIGTAKPSFQELAIVKHHFINSHSVTDNYNVGDYEKEVLLLLDKLFEQHHKVILVGGSGLYIQAVCEGFDNLPQAPAIVRNQLNELYRQKGIEYLQQTLNEVDPVYYAEVDLNNPQRLIRAIEVYHTTGKPFSEFRLAHKQERPFNIIKLALDMPRAVLYERINNRVDVMVENGLVDEVTTLLPYRSLNALNTVGYSELFDYLDGNISLAKAVETIKQNTRRFAKRQLTWLRRDTDIHWLDANTPDMYNTALKIIQQ